MAIFLSGNLTLDKLSYNSLNLVYFPYASSGQVEAQNLIENKRLFIKYGPILEGSLLKIDLV